MRWIRTRPLASWLDVLVKVALVGLLLFGLVSDLPQFQDKAWLGRALTYPAVAIVVRVVWALYRRHRNRPVAYPYTLDIVFVLSFLIDTVGNAANLYDTVGWWDDANHSVTWALLVAAFSQLLLRLPLAPLAGWAIAIGFGAVTAILWEIAEYLATIHDSSEFATAYTDTLGDLSLGLRGSLLAAALIFGLGSRPRAVRAE